MNEISVKYFSGRSLETVDLGQLFRVLFDKFGECQIDFIPMTPQQRATASTEVDGIELINERFWILIRADNGFVRQHELERVVVRLGKK